MTTLGETLHAARSHKELSLRDLSSKTNYSPTYISMVERNIENPSNNYLESMSAVLDIDARWLYESAKRIPDEVETAMVNRRILVDIVYKLMEKDDDELNGLYRRV
jgi:transcriptional regulator with XRE-family HTH domain